MSQLRRSTQTHRNAPRLAGENWAYLRFCILSFLNLRPSHLFLIIFNTNLWDNKTMEGKKKKKKNTGHMCRCSLGLDLRPLTKKKKKKKRLKLKASKVKNLRASSRSLHVLR